MALCFDRSGKNGGRWKILAKKYSQKQAPPAITHPNITSSYLLTIYCLVVSFLPNWVLSASAPGVATLVSALTGTATEAVSCWAQPLSCALIDSQVYCRCCPACWPASFGRLVRALYTVIYLPMYIELGAVPNVRRCRCHFVWDRDQITATSNSRRQLLATRLADSPSYSRTARGLICSWPFPLECSLVTNGVLRRAVTAENLSEAIHSLKVI